MEHRAGNSLKTERSQCHECHPEYNRCDQGLLTATYFPRGIVKADYRYDTGLHGTERNEEKGLPFVVEAKSSYCLIGECRKNKIQAKM